jgi:hypothetical protein
MTRLYPELPERARQHLIFVRFAKALGGVDWPGLFEQFSAQMAQMR